MGLSKKRARAVALDVMHSAVPVSKGWWGHERPPGSGHYRLYVGTGSCSSSEARQD